MSMPSAHSPPPPSGAIAPRMSAGLVISFQAVPVQYAGTVLTSAGDES